mgnify:CR=1 FL=1
MFSSDEARPRNRNVILNFVQPYLQVKAICGKIRLFREKKGFDDSFDVTKCLQQIEMPDLLHVCA